MQNWAKSCVVASVLLSGCSLFKSEPSANQVNAEPALQELKIPEGLQAPKKPGLYDIPAVRADKNTHLEKRPPTLILATAPSSRLEEEEKQVRVWFERNEQTGDLVPFLQQNIQAFADNQHIELQNISDDGLVYETGWITRTTESGFWFWKSQQPTDQARYKLALEPRPHGRTSALTVTMLEHQFFEPEYQLTPDGTKRYEIELLNLLINEVAVTETAIARANKAKTHDVTLESGLDKDGAPALLTEQSIDVAWTQIELLFAELGVEVTDMNRSVFTYYLSYTKPERSFWSKIWGKAGTPALPIADGEYQVVLSRHGTGTAISFRDKDGELLPAETVVAMYDPFVEASRTARLEL